MVSDLEKQPAFVVPLVIDNDNLSLVKNKPELREVSRNGYQRGVHVIVAMLRCTGGDLRLDGLHVGLRNWPARMGDGIWCLIRQGIDQLPPWSRNPKAQRLIAELNVF
jgi:hypothetical protein